MQMRRRSEGQMWLMLPKGPLQTSKRDIPEHRLAVWDSGELMSRVELMRHDGELVVMAGGLPLTVEEADRLAVNLGAAVQAAAGEVE